MGIMEGFTVLEGAGDARLKDAQCMHLIRARLPAQYHSSKFPEPVMRLAEYTDYTLRVLMYCAANPQRLVTIAEIADSHAVSKNHLMKIVNDLARQGVLETTRGRGGGIRLVKKPSDIRVGDIVRAAETDFRLVECFDEATNTCNMSPTCRMKRLLDSALSAYFRELDAATLADLVAPPAKGGRRGEGVVIRIKPDARAPAPAARRAPVRT
jgi:Rrf2 family nitric oxide-sensitive transcriptional repressor